jgi:hypothetical protein
VFFDRRGQKVAPNASTTDAGSSDNKSAAVKDVRGGTKAGATKGSSSNSDEVTVITGPIEHLFLAAAIPVNNVSTLKYDATSKSLIESKKPSAFFVALNIGFGDVVGTPTRVQDNFFGTLLVSASTRPLDSFGIGVGIKGRKFGDYLDLSALTFFYALTWNQSDVVNSSNKVTIGKKLRSSSQFGVGFNLNKAVEWLKKN